MNEDRNNQDVTVGSSCYNSNSKIRGSIVVVAKCPIPGKSKTRLIPLMGEMGSVRLAKSMLSDVLKTIAGCPELKFVRKIVLYAPGTSEGLEQMKTLFRELDLKATTSESTSASASASPIALDLESHGDDDCGGDNEIEEPWILLPMASSSSGKDLTSHDLGAKLEDALVRVRLLEHQPSTQSQQRQPQRHGVVFLGMDAPILPLDDIVEGLKRATISSTAGTTQEEQEAASSIISNTAAATMCPALDGGYAMLCVPPAADPTRTFSGMYWSHPLTGMSQIKALTDQGIPTLVGKIVRDIDETEDVTELCRCLSSLSPPPGQTNHDNKGEREPAKKNLEYTCRWSLGSTVGGTREDAIVSTTVTSSHPVCHLTRRALIEAGLLEDQKEGID